MWTGTMAKQYQRKDSFYNKAKAEGQRCRAFYKIEEIDKKSARVREDYFKSLHDRMSEIYSAFNDNVFQPIADGFGALLDFQLEEAQEALEKITELYDKAVEAREASAERMKEINDELRSDEGANKEALQQRLAEEEVLLVQREETERALQKEQWLKELIYIISIWHIIQ